MSEATAYEEREIALATGRVKLLDGGAEAGAKGPVVVLHHSWGSPGWLPFHTDLASRGCRVIVPDMPGWGGSERPQWAREPRDIAVIVSHLLDALGLEDAKLVGLGFGGFVAAELAAMNPSRLAALVLVGAAGLQPKEGEILDQMMLSHRKYIEESFRDADAYAECFGEEPADELRDLWDFSREMTARVTWKPYMFNRRLAPLLGDMHVPTLLAWGGQDKVVPRECAYLYKEALPNAHVEIMPGCGHVLELEEPRRLAGMVDGFPQRWSRSP